MPDASAALLLLPLAPASVHPLVGDDDEHAENGDDYD